MSNFFKTVLSDFGSSRELCSVNYNLIFKDCNECKDHFVDYFKKNTNPVLNKRLYNENHFYNFLENQLFSHLQEIKYYNTVDISSTRRLVSVSTDCISMIQILVRDVIHLNVYFRSSDFDGALPVDLMFISRLPEKLIKHLSSKLHEKGYEEVNSELLEKLKKTGIKLNLYFGSLHRTS